MVAVPTTATSSAFVQQRKKILPAALENLFQEFASQTARSDNYRGYKLLAIDGSDIQIATNPRDKASFFQTKEGVKPYNLLHLNALYNLLSHTYEDAIVYKAKEAGENKALIEMVDRSDFTTKTIVTADRGYESYNNMAHIQEKGWFYLIRVKDFGKYKTGILQRLRLTWHRGIWWVYRFKFNSETDKWNEEFIAAEEYISMDIT